MQGASLLILILAITAGLVVIQLWTRAFADLLWMFTLRKWLVGGLTLAIFLAILIIGHALWGLSAGSASLVLLSLLATPGLACRAADWVALRCAGGGSENSGAQRRGFIFAEARRQQDANYEAPPIGP